MTDQNVRDRSTGPRYEATAEIRGKGAKEILAKLAEKASTK